MTLTVHAFGAYAASTDWKWRPGDWEIYHLVKALKGETTKGYADIRGIDGVLRRVSSTTRGNAYTIFGLWGRQRLTELALGEVHLVPVPSSSCVTFEAETAPRRMARELESPNAPVSPWLRFREAMTPSHAGGSRNQAVLEAALNVSSQARGRAVLVDDVKTTGAHLKACAAVLRARGVQVDTVIVAATTVWQQVPDPRSVDPIDLEAVLDFDCPF